MSNIIQNKKFHFIYKTTNLLNETFYYGMHSTSNIKDGYLGSGTRLCHSIRKHGKENFKLEILEFLSDRETLVAKEKELITEEMLKDPLCMNLKLGGQGGFCNEEHALKFHEGGSKNMIKQWKDLNYREKISNILRANTKKSHALGKLRHDTFTSKTHSEETKQKMKSTRALNKPGGGDKNSQFGKCWIYNNKKSISIKKEQLEIYLKEGWILGRKLNFIKNN